MDNSVDEAMNGFATEITLQLHKDGETVTVADNGRGIPVDKHSSRDSIPGKTTFLSRFRTSKPNKSNTFITMLSDVA